MVQILRESVDRHIGTRVISMEHQVDRWVEDMSIYTNDMIDPETNELYAHLDNPLSFDRAGMAFYVTDANTQSFIRLTDLKKL